ncbi:hypothetical protein LIPSTDRAFT_35880, partial [Lipomyces starkeyi NRRL Y-11557]
WYTFDKYYSMTDVTSVYAAAIILHPSRRKHYIRQNCDSIYHQSAFDAVENLWKIEYKDKATVNVSTICASNDPDVFDEFARDLDVTASTITSDEYEAFANHTPFGISTTALEWWLEERQRKLYPSLQKMAIDILSIPAMSSEPERVFSGARRTISWDRARLGAANIEPTECLKSWLRSNITSGLGII